jgi:hypothetical protein
MHLRDHRVQVTQHERDRSSSVDSDNYYDHLIDARLVCRAVKMYLELADLYPDTTMEDLSHKEWWSVNEFNTILTLNKLLESNPSLAIKFLKFMQSKKPSLFDGIDFDNIEFSEVDIIEAVINKLLENSRFSLSPLASKNLNNLSLDSKRIDQYQELNDILLDQSKRKKSQKKKES